MEGGEQQKECETSLILQPNRWPVSFFCYLTQEYGSKDMFNVLYFYPGKQGLKMTGGKGPADKKMLIIYIFAHSNLLVN